MMNARQSLIGSALAFLLATSCCWLPWLIVILGGASGLASFSAGLESFSGLFILLTVVLLSWAIYLRWQQNNGSINMENVQLLSVLTCPNCASTKEEEMPTDACQYFYECTNCQTILKPKQGDCCVYCSYGTVPCPPMQLGDCC